MKKLMISAVIAFSLFMVAIIAPENQLIPVQGATEKDWNHDTFWYEPWGKSGVHKGIDIFSPAGKSVIASTYGIVLFSGVVALGGNVVVVLGPKWRLHYYAHLSDSRITAGTLVRSSEIIGSVGNSGNAGDKPPHLHYAIITLVPYLWRMDFSTQGWKKIFYLDPGERLLAAM